MFNKLIQTKCRKNSKQKRDVQRKGQHTNIPTWSLFRLCNVVDNTYIGTQF